jgi:hypothetical protein
LKLVQSRTLGVLRITSKPKSVLKQNFRFDHTRHPTGRAERKASTAAGAAPLTIELQSLFRAEVGQIDKSMQTADIHRQISFMATAHANVWQNVGQARGDIRESPLTPSYHRIPTHTRAAIAKGHAHRPGANSEASWDPAAGKKHSRNPRLSDQHQAISRRPQNSIRSFPGERPPRSANVCLQANAAAAAGATLTHL